MEPSEEPDFIEESLALAPEPYRSIVQRYLDEGVFATTLKRIEEQFGLSEEQMTTVTLIAFRAACDPDMLDSVKDALIAEVDLSYEQAVKIQRDITADFVLPIKEEGDALEGTENADDETQPVESRGGGEAKIFDTGGFVVTTEKFVYGSEVIRLDEIKGGALPFVDRGWQGALIIVAIGLGMLAWGGGIFRLIGLLCLPSAYFFFTKTIDRRLVLLLKSGEGLEVKVGSTELLNRLAEAINQAIRDQHTRNTVALRDELSSLPDAR